MAADPRLDPAQKKLQQGRDVSFYLLLLVGLVLVLTPLIPPLSGFLDRSVGLVRTLCLAQGFAFFYLGFLIRDLTGVRQRNLVIMETLLASLRGGFPRKDGEAIDILVAALRGRSESARTSALQQLQRLTGQNFGANPEAWERWRREHRDPPSSPSESRPETS